MLLPALEKAHSEEVNELQQRFELQLESARQEMERMREQLQSIVHVSVCNTVAVSNLFCCIHIAVLSVLLHCCGKCSVKILHQIS